VQQLPIPTKVQDLEGFPFESFDELQQSLASGAVRLSAAQDRARVWVGSADFPLSGPQRWFHYIFSWCWLWSSLILSAFAWPILGTKALLLPIVALTSFFINRPWTTAWVTFIAIGLTAWGVLSGNTLLAWAGGAWLLVWFLSNGWQNWCTDRFTELLGADEEFFTRMYFARNVALVLESGEQLMSS
jgi:hypothetical protein